MVVPPVGGDGMILVSSGVLMTAFPVSNGCDVKDEGSNKVDDDRSFNYSR